MNTTALLDFLLARIAEDEHRTRTGQPFVGRVTGEEDDDWVEPNWSAWHTDLCGWRTGEGLDDECSCGVPARVLAECEAKRRIVAQLWAEPHEVVDGDCWFTCAAATEEHDGGECCNDERRGGACDCGRDRRVNSYLRLLARPYADHPDYQQEWSPLVAAE